MQGNPVVWFVIHVQDMARAVAFYQQVLGQTLEPLQAPDGEAAGAEMMVFNGQPEGAGAGGALVRMEGATSGGSGTLVYFACEDCAVEAGRVEEAGGTLFKPKFPIGQYGHCALAIDPDGNMFGLHSMQ